MHLWDKPEHDPDFIMSERLTKCPCFHTNLDDDTVEELCDIHQSLCQVYYDVFNNGGCNLGDVTWLLTAQDTLKEYAKKKHLDVPEFVTWLPEDDDCPGVGTAFETIDCEPMDQFARKVIRHLYLDLTNE